METVYDLLRKLVDDHRWSNEAEKVHAHGVINRADPSYTPPAPVNVPQSADQLYIAQLEQALAAARGQGNIPQNAAQQMQQAYAAPTAPATANPAEMRGYVYPQAGAVPQPQYTPQPNTAPVPSPVPTADPSQMAHYAYPAPAQEYQPVTPF